MQQHMPLCSQLSQHILSPLQGLPLDPGCWRCVGGSVWGQARPGLWCHLVVHRHGNDPHCSQDGVACPAGCAGMHGRWGRGGHAGHEQSAIQVITENLEVPSQQFTACAQDMHASLQSCCADCMLVLQQVYGAIDSWPCTMGTCLVCACWLAVHLTCSPMGLYPAVT